MREYDEYDEIDELMKFIKKREKFKELVKKVMLAPSEWW
jgi:hypothetical protein